MDLGLEANKHSCFTNIAQHRMKVFNIEIDS